ncbi:MAG TPA: IS110 family transposase, partial [Pyrinomonadaceae bacterium]
DLGKFKSVACDYEAESGRHRFATVLTTPKALHDLIVDREPDRVVIESCSIAGWVGDLVRSLGIELQVANTADERWRWRNVKQKNDRHDALKTAQLSAVNQLCPVHVPERRMRQWRALIAYRSKLVQRRTKIKNHIRDLLLREGQLLPRGRSAWTEAGMASLAALAQPLAEMDCAQLWRGELAIEMAQLKELQQQILMVQAKLDELAAADPRIALLRTIPGVGPRLAEAIVTMFDDVTRFATAGQVGAYIGMVPKSFDSGETERSGRITRQGNRLVRSLLVEIAWAAMRHNPWARQTFQRISGGKKSRRKIAIVAVGRKLLVKCWGMLRHQTPWRYHLEAATPDS